MPEIKVSDLIYRILLGLMVAMLVVMVATVSLNVLMRYFGKGLLWVEEISNLAFVWMSFVAMALGWQFNMHPGFELFKTDSPLYKKFRLLGLILILIFLLYAFKGGWDYSVRIANQKTPILDMSVSWKYAAVPFAAFFMIIETIRKITNLIKAGTITPNPDREDGDLK